MERGAEQRDPGPPIDGGPGRPGRDEGPQASEFVSDLVKLPRQMEARQETSNKHCCTVLHCVIMALIRTTDEPLVIVLNDMERKPRALNCFWPW